MIQELIFNFAVSKLKTAKLKTASLLKDRLLYYATF